MDYINNYNAVSALDMRTRETTALSLLVQTLRALERGLEDQRIAMDGSRRQARRLEAVLEALEDVAGGAGSRIARGVRFGQAAPHPVGLAMARREALGRD